jgi:hypothetical protein
MLHIRLSAFPCCGFTVDLIRESLLFLIISHFNELFYSGKHPLYSMRPMKSGCKNSNRTGILAQHEATIGVSSKYKADSKKCGPYRNNDGAAECSVETCDILHFQRGSSRGSMSRVRQADSRSLLEVEALFLEDLQPSASRSGFFCF